jgi:hypothetical protein
MTQGADDKTAEGAKAPSAMSDEEFATWVSERMMAGWVPLRTYLRHYPDETQAKIDTRLARGVWTRGVHYSVPPQSRAWVNLLAIRKWIESGGDGPEA